MNRAWTRLSDREKWIARVCGIVLVSAGLWQFVWIPAQDFVDSLDKEIVTQQSRLARYEAYARSAPLKNAGSAKDQNRNDDMAALLKELQRLAKESSVRITEIKPHPAENTRGRNVQTVEIKIEDSFSLDSRFLFALQNSAYVINTRRLSLVQTGASYNIDMNITIERTVS